METKISEDNRSFSFAVGALPNLSEEAQSPDWKHLPGCKALLSNPHPSPSFYPCVQEVHASVFAHASSHMDMMPNFPPGGSVKNTSNDNKRSSFVETVNKLPVESQVDKSQGGLIVSSASDDSTKMTSLQSEIQQHPTSDSSALAHQPFTDGQRLQLVAQILVYADLVQGKPPTEATMVRAFGQPVGGHKHAWEEALCAAVDKLQNEKSPGLETPSSSRIGSCTAERGSKDTAVGKTMIAEAHSSKTHSNSLQHGDGEKVSLGLDDGIAKIQPVKTAPWHDEPTSHTASILPSVSCNGAIRGDKSETNHPPENTTEHAKTCEQQTGDKAHLEVSCADKVNLTLYDDDDNILKKNTVCGGQTTLESHCCNVALHDKSSEANSSPKKNTGNNMADTQKSCCTRSVPNSLRDANEGAKQASNKKITGNTMAETSHVYCSDDGFTYLLSVTDNMPFCTKDKDTNSLIAGLAEQDMCVKCGKDGQLLKCSSCFLAAHERCFGSSVTFGDSGQFDCPVCFYNKAAEAYTKSKKAYSEASKILSAFLGSKQFANQRDEQSTGRQQRAANRNIDVAEHEQPMENAKACEEDGNGNSSYEVQHLSQNRCSPVANQNVEADKDDGLTSSHKCANSDKVEATSWRNMRHRKARCQEEETAVSKTCKDASGRQDQYVPSPSRKRYYAYPLERYFTPVAPTRRPLAPTGRRARLLWTEGEEAALREAVTKFTKNDKGAISWVQIREYGRDVFHEARRPEDLRAKWKNMKKKSGS